MENIESVMAHIKAKRNKIPKIFLGGTCNKSTWRDELIPQLKIEYFNPVVPNWTEEAYKQELLERENADYCLYTITPLMTGVYSIAEVIDDVNKRPRKTLLCVLETDGELEFSPVQKKSLLAVSKMVALNGGKVFSSLEEIAQYVNTTPLYQSDDTAILELLMEDLVKAKQTIVAHMSMPSIVIPFKPEGYPEDSRVVNYLHFICPDCGAPLGDYRGSIQERFKTIEIRANGYCLPCQKSVYNHVRWHKEGHWTAFFNGNWVDITFDESRNAFQRFFDKITSKLPFSKK